MVTSFLNTQTTLQFCIHESLMGNGRFVPNVNIEVTILLEE